MSEQNIVITGATGGLGRALVALLRERGASVLALGRHKEALDALAQQTGAETALADVLSGDSVKDAVRSWGPSPTGIACCVGSLLLKPAHRTTDAELMELLSVNIGSAFAAVHTAGNLMRRGGSVVLVSSAAGLIGMPNHEAIAAAKAGVAGLARAAAASYASRGLRVNAVAPGLMETPLAAPVLSNEMSKKATLAMHALGRVGQPAEVAQLMAWLLSDDGSWVTGQVFGADGGLSTVMPRMRI